jgi:hypothetical protein
MFQPTSSLLYSLLIPTLSCHPSSYFLTNFLWGLPFSYSLLVRHFLSLTNSGVSNVDLIRTSPILVAVRSKAWVCGRLFTGIMGSNPAGSTDVCLLWVLRVVRYKSMRRAGYSNRGVLPNVVYPARVIVKSGQWESSDLLGAAAQWNKILFTMNGL